MGRLGSMIFWYISSVVRPIVRSVEKPTKFKNSQTHSKTDPVFSSSQFELVHKGVTGVILFRSKTHIQTWCHTRVVNERTQTSRYKQN